MALERTLISVTGPDAEKFLQGLVTNDVARARDGIIYTALLTPQGKFIADFFLIGQPNGFLVDVASSHAQTLGQKLTMYRLRSDVQIAVSDLIVSRGTGPMPDGALPDPRHDALGWRAYTEADLSDDTDWTALRVAHLIPETGIELTPDSYILEAGFERLHGVDFKKGCFVGQEIVARMKHKTTLRKGLVRVSIDGSAKTGDDITTNGKTVGTLYSIAGNHGIAFLRFDRATSALRAGDAVLTWEDAPNTVA